jgi:dUTP pyrophosphatase
MRAYWSGDGAQPNLAHEGDAGFDLAHNGTEPIVVQPNQTVNIPTGIRVALPYGVWGMITGRSSTFKRDLLTPLSVIDNGYRGDLFAIVRNIGTQPVTIQPAERVAQLIPVAMLADVIEWQHMLELDDTERGSNGFGSTGK